MRRLFAIASFVLAACLAPAALAAPAAAAPTQTAIYAGGCFWCAEHDLAAVPGVVDVVSGYTGGTLANPRYDDVITETTGHYEAVKVTFDPAKITYRALTDRFFRIIDPTDGGGQFCDRGPSYRSAVFATPEQKPIADAARAAAAAALKKPVATQVLAVSTFWPAETYHQDYAAKNPARYLFYRSGCGRDARVKEVWRGVK
ncbi:MAG: peptide-methionine (S)-S-oxide reductase MsrA [Caulobacterales bacterium]